MYKKEEATALKFTKEGLSIISRIAMSDCTHVDCSNCECRLIESLKAGTVTMEGCIPIVLLEIAKTLSIIADTLENIDRRKSDAKEQTNL